MFCKMSSIYQEYSCFVILFIWLPFVHMKFSLVDSEFSYNTAVGEHRIFLENREIGSFVKTFWNLALKVFLVNAIQHHCAGITWNLEKFMKLEEARSMWSSILVRCIVVTMKSVEKLLVYYGMLSKYWLFIKADIMPTTFTFLSINFMILWTSQGSRKCFGNDRFVNTTQRRQISKLIIAIPSLKLRFD